MTFGLREREREMANSIPIFRERESKWKIPIQFSGTGTVMKIPFPFSGTGMRVKNSIPNFRDGNWRTVFPEFQRIPGIGNFSGYCYCKFATSRLGIGILQIFGLVTHCLGKGGCLKWCQNTGIAKSSSPPPPSILAPFFTSTLPLPCNILHCTNAYKCNKFHRFVPILY